MKINLRAWTIPILVLAMLVTGSINTLSKKWQNQQTSIGVDGHEKKFSFPWTQTLFMFLGESLCLIAYAVWKLYQHCTNQDKGRHESLSVNEDEAKQSLLRDNDPTTDVESEANVIMRTESEFEVDPTASSLKDINTISTDIATPEQPAREPWYTPFLFLITCGFDVIGTTLGGIGLLYTYASVFQMLRGSIIVFSGILSVLFLKRKLYAYNWLGIAVTTAGLACVGIASVIGNAGGKSIKEVILGDVLIILGQLANAIQMIIEEIFLKRRNYHALVVVGGEGAWGVILMMAAVLPIVYAIPGDQDGHYENAIDGFVMIGNNATLLGLVILYWLSISFYNFTSLSVAKNLTTVHRTFIDALRTVCVWVVQLLVFYAFDHSSLGEGWGKYSFLQMFGFGLLIAGTLIYNGILQVSFLYYPQKEDRH